MRVLRRFFAAVVACSLGTSAAAAATFTSANIFGDSLSDVGNLFRLTSIFTPNNIIPDPAKYYNGRMSNGPIWVEYLLPRLGLPAPTPSLLGGTDFAYAGAWASGPAIPPPLNSQVSSYLQSGVITRPTDLFIVWAGANDFISGTPEPAAVANAVLGQVQILENAGARQFLVLNLPPLGQTPDMAGATAQEKAAANAAAQLYNQTLATGLAGIQNSLGTGGKVYQVDIYGLFQSMIADPGKYGFTNVTDPFPGALADPAASTYLFWDTVHPTTAAHKLLADAAYAAIPEPAAIAVLVLSCGLLLRRRA